MDSNEEKGSSSQVIIDQPVKTVESNDDPGAIIKSVGPEDERAVIESKAELTKEESSRISGEIWARVYRHYGWLITAIVGGMGFGSIFPGLHLELLNVAYLICFLIIVSI